MKTAIHTLRNFKFIGFWWWYMILVLTEILKITQSCMVTKCTQHFRGWIFLNHKVESRGQPVLVVLIESASLIPSRGRASDTLGFFFHSLSKIHHSYSYSHAYRMDRTITVMCPTLITHEITTLHHLLKVAENLCQL